MIAQALKQWKGLSVVHAARKAGALGFTNKQFGILCVFGTTRCSISMSRHRHRRRRLRRARSSAERHRGCTVKFRGPRKPTRDSDAAHVHRYLEFHYPHRSNVWEALLEHGITGIAIYQAASKISDAQSLLSSLNLNLQSDRLASILALLVEEFGASANAQSMCTRAWHSSSLSSSITTARVAVSDIVCVCVSSADAAILLFTLVCDIITSQASHSPLAANNPPTLLGAASRLLRHRSRTNNLVSATNSPNLP